MVEGYDLEARRRAAVRQALILAAVSLGFLVAFVIRRMFEG